MRKGDRYGIDRGGRDSDIGVVGKWDRNSVISVLEIVRYGW